MSEITVGSLVVHRNCSDWGLGKVFRISDGYVLVGFLGLPLPDRLKRLSKHSSYVQLASIQRDAAFDGWKVESTMDCRPIAAAVRTGGKASLKARPPLVAEWTYQQAFERFLQRYPDGFAGSRYQEAERASKWEKHEMWRAEFGVDGLRQAADADPVATARRLMRVVQTTGGPLLDPRGEIPVLTHALESPDETRAYLLALADFLGGEARDSGRFERLAKALTALPVSRPKAKVGTWSTLTVVPFLAQPARHMFLKPVPTRDIAKRVGFDLVYSPALRADTYHRLLDFSAGLLDFLRPHGAQDYIDVQSFIGTLAKP